MALITTKAGDKGMTQLNPDRISSKCHPVIEIMGQVDELNCALGLEGDRFDFIQTFLSELMGYMYYKTLDTKRLTEQVEILEEYINTHNNSIPTWFVNPRGGVSLARAICRRVERHVVALADEERANGSEKYVDWTPVIQYFNRLSDYLFVKTFERAIEEPQLFEDEMAEPTQLFAANG